MDRQTYLNRKTFNNTAKTGNKNSSKNSGSAFFNNNKKNNVIPKKSK